jgi:acetolactate synthase-1/3 small subunit
MSASKHTLVALVEDKPGVLNKVASLFRRRGFNIESIAVGRIEQPGLSRMTIVVDSDSVEVEQIRKQFDKLMMLLLIR